MNCARLSLVCAASFLVLLTLGVPLPAFASATAQQDRVCADLNKDLVIPADGTWLSLCWSDPAAPVKALVTEVNLKILIDYPDPNQLEIQLARAGSDDVILLSSSEITAEGVGDYSQIQAFAGTPAQSEWILRVRNTTPGEGGKLLAFWLVPSYTPFVETGTATADSPDLRDQAGSDFTPESVEWLYLEGQFRYYDRKGVIRPARDITVEIWDEDYPGDGGADDLLATLTVDHNGYYVAPDIINWDVDGTSPDPAERRLDIYVRWKSGNANFKVTRSDGSLYTWRSPMRKNISSNEVHNVNGILGIDSNTLRGMWIFQDMQRTREFFLTQTHPMLSPGFLTAHWEKDRNEEWPCDSSCFQGTHIFIAHNSALSNDIVVHELGHHVMYNRTGQWYIDPACFVHTMFQPINAGCAWFEGWANFFALAVNGDRCYDINQNVCGANSVDLENHTINDNPQTFPFSDTVEGRVAGALYDLMDFSNEHPWFDTAACGFHWIANNALAWVGKNNFYHFYQGSPLDVRHDTLRSIWQNTIDYDQPPIANPIPTVRTLQNATWNNVLDLTIYTSDPESPKSDLIYTFVSQSNANCGVSFNSYLVSVAPTYNWVGICTVTYRVSDTLKTTTSSFSVQVAAITSRVYLPVVVK